MVLLVLTSIQFASTTEIVPMARAETPQPHELLFFKPSGGSEEDFIAAWETVQNMPGIGNLLAIFGNFSVLVVHHIYTTPLPPPWDPEWWVILTSLQPDVSGLIRQGVFEVWEYEGRFSFWGASISTRWLNPVNATEVARRMTVFWGRFSEPDLYFMGPFAIYTPVSWPSGGTVVLNVITGRLLIAATWMYMGTGDLLFITSGDAAGDINRDNKVDIKDIARVAIAYGSSLGDPDWDPVADITGPAHLVPDGKVDVRDIAFAASYFGVNFGEIY